MKFWSNHKKPVPAYIYVVSMQIDAYDSIKPSFDLYFSTKTGGYKYVDPKFIALSQAIETYHRRTSRETLMSIEKFDDLKNQIINQCPEEHKKWLEGRIQHGNEISLSKRVKRIIEPFKEAIGSSAEREKLINKISVTRNYLTHYNESLASQAASGIELVHLTMKIEVIFQLNMLQILGFTKEEIMSIIQGNYEIKQILKTPLPSST